MGCYWVIIAHGIVVEELPDNFERRYPRFVKFNTASGRYFIYVKGKAYIQSVAGMPGGSYNLELDLTNEEKSQFNTILHDCGPDAVSTAPKLAMFFYPDYSN